MREIDVDKTKLSISRQSNASAKPVSMQMRAKLSDYYTEKLSENEIQLTKFLIQSTVRVNIGLGISPLFIAKTEGKIFYRGEWHDISPKGYTTSAVSIGEVIGEAVRTGLITRENLDKTIEEYKPATPSTLPVEELRYMHTKLLEEDKVKASKFVRILNKVGNSYSSHVDMFGRKSAELRNITVDILMPNKAKEDKQARKEREAKMSQRDKERAQRIKEDEEQRAKEQRERESKEALERQSQEALEKKLAEDKRIFEEAPDSEWLERKFDQIIEYLDRGDSEIEDVVSTATYKNSFAMLEAGIPKEAIVHAYAATWSEHVRDELEIPRFNPLMYGEPIEGQHRATAYIEKLVDAGIPILMVGPTQTGKGFISKNIAKNRGLGFGSVPLNAGTSIMWLFGRNMPQEFVGTDFLTCYEHGGVFLFDEIDAADSNLLIAVNDALSNGVLSNPIKNARIKKHENFIALAAANTWGLGADADYTGRTRLDAATLERFRMGRVFVDYDRELQKKILRGEIA